MHRWGDKDFSDDMFNMIENAAYEIGEFCRRWSRMHVSQTKEKFGTARVYCSFGIYNVNTLFYPGYHYIQRPTWLMNLVFPQWEWLQTVIFNYQKLIYNLAYKKAFKKYPAIVKEIYSGADWKEYIDVPGHMLQGLLQDEKDQASQEVMDLFFALRAIKGTPRLKDLVKLAKRIKR